MPRAHVAVGCDTVCASASAQAHWLRAGASEEEYGDQSLGADDVFFDDWPEAEWYFQVWQQPRLLTPAKATTVAAAAARRRQGNLKGEVGPGPGPGSSCDKTFMMVKPILNLEPEHPTHAGPAPGTRTRRHTRAHLRLRFTPGLPRFQQASYRNRELPVGNLKVGPLWRLVPQWQCGIVTRCVP